MQTFIHEQRYSHPVDVMLENLTDLEFLQKQHAEQGHQDVLISSRGQGEQKPHFRVSYSDVPRIELPDFARRFVPGRAHVERTVEWDLTRKAGVIRVNPKGVPATMEGDMELRDLGGECAIVVSWKVHCGIPLLGGKVERLLIESVKQGARLEWEATERLLPAQSKAS